MSKSDRKKWKERETFKKFLDLLRLIEAYSNTTAHNGSENFYIDGIFLIFSDVHRGRYNRSLSVLLSLWQVMADYMADTLVDFRVKPFWNLSKLMTWKLKWNDLKNEMKIENLKKQDCKNAFLFLLEKFNFSSSTLSSLTFFSFYVYSGPYCSLFHSVINKYWSTWTINCS